LNFFDKKEKLVDTSVSLVTKLVSEQETQLRRLDTADNAMKGEFTTQPPIQFCYEQFSSEMLVKPSVADNLVDLQAEFNAMKLDKNGGFGEQGEKDVEMKEQVEWTLAKYYE
jgi:hypothetical protein